MPRLCALSLLAALLSLSACGEGPVGPSDAGLTDQGYRYDAHSPLDTGGGQDSTTGSDAATGADSNTAADGAVDVDSAVTSDAAVDVDSGVTSDAAVGADSAVASDAAVDVDSAVASDAAVDVDSAVTSDAAVDVDSAVASDAAVDVDSAVASDAAVDADSAVTGDAASGSDAGEPLEVSLAELRAMLDGVVDVVLSDVYVTYVRDVGYYLQAEQTGPAIFVYTSSVPTVAVGNRISLAVTELATYGGLKEIVAASVLGNDHGSFDVHTNLAQDLAAGSGLLVDENLESELVVVGPATAVSGFGRDWVVEYGSTPSQAALYVQPGVTTGLCAGATFNLVRGLVMDLGGAYEISAYSTEDIVIVSSAACVTPDDSNWDFEDWPLEPARDFFFATGAFSASQESTLVHGGSSAAQLIWTATSTQRIDAEYGIAVTPGIDYACSLWVYDDDPAGDVRVYPNFFDASGEYIVTDSHKFAPYSGPVDASWQELSHSFTAPAEAASMRCTIRMYDLASDWDGNATVYIDDLTAGAL